MNKKTKISITIIGIVVLLFGLIQVRINAADNIAPEIIFYEAPGEILKGEKTSAYISDESGIVTIKYCWDNEANKQNPTIIQKDPAETVLVQKFDVPEEIGVHILWIRAMDKFQNETPWLPMSFYVVNSLSSTSDTQCPQLDLSNTSDFPLSNSEIELGREITIRAVDNQTGVFYIAHKWSREMPSQNDNASNYTFSYNTDTVITNAPTETGTWYLTIFMADTTTNQSSRIYYRYNVIDNINPVLTLNGAAEMDVNLGETFTDPGATFSDNYDAEKIIYSTDIVDTSRVGKYVLNYRTEDSSGNESNNVTRIVTVVGTEDTVELTLPTKRIYKFGEELDLTGAQVKEITKRGEETIIPVTSDMFEGFTTQVVGLNSIFFTYNDEKIIYTYEVKDYMQSIRLTLPTKLVYEYKEELDLTGGFVQKVMASGIEMTKEAMDISMVSGFSSQAVGQVTLTVEYLGKREYFTVEIVDSYAPEITLNGDNPQIIEVWDEYRELGATATDIYDDEKGQELHIIIDASNVNTNVIGEYIVTYTCSDSLGKTTVERRTIKVVDTTTIPEITINGNEVESLEIGEIYTDAGATATDAYDGDLTNNITTTIKKQNGEIVSQIDTSATEIYTIEYNVSDVSGNEAEARTRTVHVVDHSELNRLRNEVVPNLRQEDYYSSSWENLQNIISNLQERYQTQAEINAKIEEVQNALNGLETILSKLTYNLSSVVYNGVEQPVIVTPTEEIGEVTVKYNGTTEKPINVGRYEITVDIAETTGYEAKTNIVLGTYEITKKSVTVEAEDKTSVYGEALKELTITIPEGTLVGEDTEADLGVTLVKANGSVVGNYAITGTSNSANYDVTVTEGNYEITKKPVTVVAENKTSVYGDVLEELTINIPEGTLVGEDTEEDLGVTLAKANGSVVGNYAITGTSNSANYDVIVTQGNYEITKKAVTVEAEDKTSIYGNALEELTINIPEGILVGEDTEEDLGVTLVKANGSVVGNYAITGTSNSANYEVTVTAGNYEITKKPVTVVAENKTSVYGDVLEELTINIPEGTLVGQDTEADLGVTLVKANGSVVGNYAITGTSNSANYEVTVTAGNYEITKKPVTAVAENKTSVYGDVLEELTINIPEGTLVGQDTEADLGVTLAKANGSVVGNYAITGTSNSTNYDVTVTEGNYEITKKSVTVAAENKTSVYGDVLEELTISIPEGILVGEDTEEDLGVTLVKANGSVVGNYAITGTSNSANYDVTVTPGNYAITRRGPVLGSLVYDLTSKAYTGEAQPVEVTANNTLQGFGAITVKYYQEVDGIETEVGTPVSKGMYIVKVDIAEGANYSAVNGLLVGNYEITAKAPSIEDLSYDLTSKEYNGEAQGLTITAKPGIVGLGNVTVKYNGSTQLPTNAGIYTITVDIATGANYDSATNMAIGTYEITKKSVTVTAENKTSVYGETLKELTFAITDGELATGDTNTDLAVNLVKEDGLVVNNYAITGRSTSANYNVTVLPGNYEIIKKSVTVAAEDKTSVYGDALKLLTISIPEGTLVGQDTEADLGVTLAKANGSVVGNYVITGTSNSANYDVTVTEGNYEITKKSVTVAAENKTSVYGDVLEELTINIPEGTLVGQDTEANLGVTLVKANGSVVGNYAITGTSNSANYDVTVTEGNYEITKKPVTVVAENKTSVYGDDLEELTINIPEGTLVGQDTEANLGVTLVKANGSVVGNYAITGTSNSANYDVTVTAGNYEITKKSVTVAAENKTSVYGDVLEELTINIPEGTLVGQDTEANLGVTLVKANGSVVGNYAITGTSNSANYDVTVTAGNYEIIKKSVTVAAEDKTSVYGDILEELTINIPEGTLVGQDTEADLGVTLAKANGSVVGNYAITGTSNSANYNVTITPGNYEITRRGPVLGNLVYDLTSKQYTGEAQPVEVTANSALQGFGAITVKYYQEVDGIETEVGTPVAKGMYIVKVDIAEGTNYSAVIGLLVGNYEITSKAPSIEDLSYDLTSKEYNGEEQGLTITAKPGIVGLGNVTVKYNGSTQLPTNVGTYTITVDIATGANYDSATNMAIGTYEITKKSVTVIAENKTSVYGEALKLLTISIPEGTLVGEDTEADLGVTLVKANGSVVGNYAITGTSNSANYDVTVTEGNYEITKKPVTVVAENKTSVYGDDLEELTINIPEGTLVGEDTEANLGVTLVKANGSVVGNYAITGTSNSANYDVTVTAGNYEITKKAVTVTAEDKTSVYGEALKLLTISIPEGTLVGEDTEEDLRVTLVKANGSVVGNYAITGTSSSSNYAVTVTPGNYEITRRAPVLGNLVYDLTSKAYTGEAQPVEVTANSTLQGFGAITVKYYQEIDGLETEVGTPVAKGMYIVKVDIAEGANYSAVNGLLVGNYEITAKAPSIEDLSYDLTSKEYNGEAQGLTITAKPGIVGLGNVTVKYNGSTELPVNAGIYTITVDIATGANYDSATSMAIGTYEITRRGPVLGNLVYDLTSKQYTGEAQPVEVTANSALQGFGAITVKYYQVVDGIETEVGTPVSKGMYIVKVDIAEGANYSALNGLLVGNYEITAKAPSIEDLSYDLTSKEYNGEAQGLTIIAKPGIAGLGNVTVKYNGSTQLPTNAGTYTITVDIATGANYDSATNMAIGTYEITKKSVTVAAENKTSVYGDVLEELTINIPEGTLVGQDTEADLGVTLVKANGSVVGNYAITGTSSSSNYTVTVTPGNYEITKKAVTVTAEDKTSVYGEALKLLTISIPEGTLVGEDTEEDLGVTLVKANGSVVGNYAITGTSSSSNYAVTVTPGNYEITRRAPVLGNLVYDLTSKAYTGEAQPVEVTANSALQGFGAITVKYYQVVDGIETEVGTPVSKGMYIVKVDISEGANYSAVNGLLVGNYEITAKAPSIEDLSYNLTSKEYNGEAQGLTITAKPGIVGLGNVTVKYNGSTELPVNAGIYTITVDIATGANYDSATDMAIGTYEITKKSVTVAAENKTSVYGETLKELTFAITDGELATGDTNTDLAVNLVKEDGLVVNNYAITGTSTSANYNVTVLPGNYEITKKAVTVTADDKTSVYGETLKELTFAITEGSLAYEDANTDLAVNLVKEDGLVVNNYAITGTSTSANYNVTVLPGNYEITKRAITVTADDKTSVYGEALKELTFAITEGSLAYEDTNTDLAIDLVKEDGLVVDNYKITGTSNSANYDVTVLPGNYEITKRAITVTADDKTSVYGEALKELTFAITEGSLAYEDTNTDLAIDLVKEDGLVVDNYEITGTSNSANYDVTVLPGNYEITKRAITVTADDKTSVYGETLKELTFAITEGSLAYEDANTDLAVNLVKEDGLVVDNYEITGTSTSANYNVTVLPGNYEITKRAIIVTADDKTSVYGEALKELTFAITEGSLAYEDTNTDLAVDLVKEDGLVVDNYEITGTSNSANYNVTIIPGNYAITRRTPVLGNLVYDLTSKAYTGEAQPVEVTANSALQGFGAITVKYYQEVDGIETEVGTPVSKGMYIIKVDIAEGANYSALNGLLVGNYEITAKAPSIEDLSYDLTSKEYNGEAQGLTITAKPGIVGLGNVIVKYNGSTQLPTNAGTYVVTVDIATGANYDSATSMAIGTYEITKKAVTIAAEDKTSVYGDVLVELTINIPEGTLVGQDTEADLGVTLVKANGSVVGNYAITGTSSSSNYTVTVTPGNYEITKKAVTVTAEDKTSVYGEALKLLTISIPEGTLVGEDTETDLGVTLAKANGSVVGNYAITGTSNSANYDVTVTAGNYEITKRVIIVTADDKTSVYGEALKELTFAITEGSLAYEDTNTDLAVDLVKEDGLVVDNYAITGRSTSANYNVTVLPGNYEITKKSVTVAAENKTSVYGDVLEELTINIPEGTLVGQDTETDLGVTLVKANGSVVGNYAITGTSNSANYDVTVTAGNYEIIKKSVTVAAEDKTSVYGEELKLLTISIPEGTLVGEDTEEDLGVTLVKANGSVVGNYTITGTSNSANYAVTVTTGNYEITRRAPVLGNLSYDLTSKAYTGEAKPVEVIANSTLQGFGAITVKYYQEIDGIETEVGTPVSKGMYIVKVDIAEGANYSAVTGLLVGNYEITAKAPSIEELSYDLTSKEYNGEAQGLTIIAKPGIVGLGNVIVKYNGSTQLPVNAGTYVVTVDIATGANYDSIASMAIGTYEITKKSVIVTAENKTSVYGETLKELTFAITEGSLAYEDTNTDLAVGLVKEDGLVVDNYAITGRSTSANYNVTVLPGNYEITKRAITVTADDKTSVYGETLKELTFAITEGSLAYEDTNTDLAVNLVKEDGLVVNNYAITGRSTSANYNVTVLPGNYEITKRAITVTADDKTSVYGEALKLLTIGIPEGTLVGEDTEEDLGVTLVKANGSVVGNYAITGTSSSSNYDVTITPGNYEITRRAPVLGNLSYDLTSKAYTGEAQPVEVTANSALQGFGAITVKYYQEVDGIETEVGTPVSKGMYIVKVDIAEGANYSALNGLLVGNYEITAKAPSIEDLSYDLSNKVYNGEAQGLTITAKPGIVGLGNVIVKYNGSTQLPTNAGTYVVTVDIETGANYDSIASMAIGTYEITKKAVIVEAEDKTSVYGDALEELTINTPEGTLVGEDTEADLGVTLSKADGSVVGNYAITGTSNSANYDVIVIPGNYEITRRAPVLGNLVYDLTSKAYTGEAKPVEVTANSALQGFGTITVKYYQEVDGVETEVGTPVSKGMYIVKVDIAEGANYSALNGLLVGNYEITAKAPSIEDLSYDLTSKEYNGEAQGLTITAKPGIVGLGNVTVKYNGSTQLPTNAGTYVVTVDIATGANYDSATNMAIGTYEITKANPNYTIPTLNEIVYNENKTLANITLPEGWSWVDETIVPTVNINEYAARYTINNPNYNDIYINLSLTVLEPADQTELNAYLAQIDYENLIPTDYTNFDGLVDLVEEAREQTAQVYLDEIVEEIKAYNLIAKPVDQTALDNYMLQINQLVETDYNNWENLETKIAEAYATTDLQSNFDAKFEEVKYFKLSIKPLDKTELIEIERQFANLNETDYTTASWTAIEEKIEQAKKQKLQSKLDSIVATINLSDLVAKQVSSIEIVTLPSKTTYVYGEALDLSNGTLNVQYDNGTSETIEMTEEGVTCTNFSEVINTLGEHVLTISYEGKTAIYRIEVIDEITGIEIDVTNMKKDYLYGEELDLTNATIKPVMKSLSSVEAKAITTDMVAGYNKTTLGEQEIEVSYLGYTKYFTVNVADYTTSIKVTAPSRISYIEGDELDLTGMVITKVLASGATQEISQSEVSITGYNKTIVGAQEIVVTYGEFTDSFRVAVVDSTKPVIALNGQEEITLEVGTNYEEQRATAFGDEGELTNSISITYVKVTEAEEVEVQSIDTSVLATYKAKYNVTDSRDNRADEVIRTIRVVDTTKPVITIDENNIYEIDLKGTIPEIRATATDNFDRNITVDIDVTAINANEVGTYVITFTATDTSLNTATETREFKVVDREAPVITLNGQNPYIVEVNTSYVDLGATAIDNAGNFNSKLNLNNLDMTKLGTYTVIYTAKDASGNEATPVERTIKVVDTTKPEFTSFKDGKGSVISIEKGTEYVDEGAIFTDNYDGRKEVMGEGIVNYNKVGTYTITYKLVDSSNNESEEIVRTVVVTDYPPVISYYDEYNAKVILNEGKVFNYYPVVFFNRGTAKLYKNGVEIEYTETELTDGTYKIKVTAEDGTSTTRNFIVDTTAPVVTGVRAGRYLTAVTITFEDVSDVERATLTNVSTNEVIDVKAWLEANNTNQYVVSTTGTYTLQVEDKYRNAIMPITFRVQI